MADNRNPLLRQAFEEAAKVEIESLPEEKHIFTDEFEKRINKVIEFKEENKSCRCSKFKKPRWSILVAATLMIIAFAFTTSALVKGDNLWKLLDFTPNSENYESVEIDIEGTLETGSDFDTLIYSGNSITVKYNIDTGESWKWPDRGIMIYLDGVKQSFDAKVEGREYKNIGMLHIKNERGTVRTIEITFEPSIGKKGDELLLSVVDIFDPYVTYYPQCNTEHKRLFVSHHDSDKNNICDKCLVNLDEIPEGPSSYTMLSERVVKIIMEEDAVGHTAVTDSFSGTKVSELDRKIYESYEYEAFKGNKYNEYDSMEGIVASVYKRIENSYRTESGAYEHETRIETVAKDADEFTVNLHGASGKYRVSIHINNEVQNVFDGLPYADVDVVHGKQTELNFTLDTTGLPEGDNYCYVLFQKLDGAEDSFRFVDTSLIYTIEVKQ